MKRNSQVYGLDGTTAAATPPTSPAPPAAPPGPAPAGHQLNLRELGLTRFGYNEASTATAGSPGPTHGAATAVMGEMMHEPAVAAVECSGSSGSSHGYGQQCQGLRGGWGVIEGDVPQLEEFAPLYETLKLLMQPQV